MSKDERTPNAGNPKHRLKRLATAFFVGSGRQFTPSPPEARRRRGVERGGRPDELPLSPFVPHGERGLARRAASGRLAVRLKTSCSPRAGTRPTIIPRESTCVVGPVPSPGAFFNGLLDIFAPKHQRKSTSEEFCLPPFRHSDLSGLLALSSLRNTTLTPPSFGLLKRSSRPGAGWAGGIEDAASFFSPSGSSAERSAPWTSSAQ